MARKLFNFDDRRALFASFPYATVENVNILIFIIKQQQFLMNSLAINLFANNSVHSADEMSVVKPREADFVRNLSS